MMASRFVSVQVSVIRCDVAGQLPRVAVDLAACETDACCRMRSVRLVDRCRLGEHPEGVVLDHAVDALDVADHVVVEHAGDLPALGLRDLGHVPAAEQPLLLARETGEHHRRAELQSREHARRLHRSGHARGVVVGPRGVRLEVGVVGHARVDVAAHDHVAIGMHTCRGSPRGRSRSRYRPGCASRDLLPARSAGRSPRGSRRTATRSRRTAP